MSPTRCCWPLAAFVSLALAGLAPAQTPAQMERDPVGVLHTLETATDPHTVAVRREGADGFVVYSAGPDGKYDGGKPGDKAASGMVLFRYPILKTPAPGEAAR